MSASVTQATSTSPLPRKSSVRFLPVPISAEAAEDLAMTTVNIGRRGGQGGVTTSIWVLLAGSVQVLSSLLYIIAFLTVGWGVVNVVATGKFEEESWDFGLWQCCRRSDGLCMGPRWPAYFTATRTFAVLGLFGHVLSAAWLLGYMFESILDYDPCTLLSLTALDIFTAVCSLLQVSIFGTSWPSDMEETFDQRTHHIEASLGFSFSFIAVTIGLIIAATIFTIAEWRITIPRLARDHHHNPFHRQHHHHQHHHKQHELPVDDATSPC